MKYQIILIIIVIGNILKAQQFEFHLNSDNLEYYQDNIYQDEYGKCFEKTLLLRPYDDKTEYRNVMTKQIESGNLLLTITEVEKKWINKKAEGRCLSANPNDCNVWCLQEIPSSIIEVEIIDEPILTEVNNIEEEYAQLLMDSGFIVFSETNCELNESIISGVYDKLLETFDTPNTDELQFLGLIRQYQYDNDLPIGGFNLETLYEMGVIEN